jgi:hypothetical protein
MCSMARVMLGLFSALLFSGTAGAASITEIQLFSATSPSSSNLIFPQFDPSQGTLNSVTLGDSFFVSATAVANGVLLPPIGGVGPPTCTAGFGSETATFTGITGTSEPVLSAAFDSTCTGSSITQTNSFVLSASPGSPLPYIGLGTVSLPVSFTLSGSGSGMTGDTSSVTYNYTPFSAVPEPATFLPVLLAMGLATRRKAAGSESWRPGSLRS